MNPPLPNYMSICIIDKNVNSELHGNPFSITISIVINEILSLTEILIAFRN